ncbi:STAS domain-containing protein [Ideonella sp. BN130291]|uniref:STAS domain-containing protein n=1 Tax=Ideonella sp. BN130291 TaxID=3112940 RepID=UPI002E26F208|nr:STAS domain-containing protein [Ideonella sp. BN130291]
MLLLPETVTLREAQDTLRMLSQALQRDGGDLLTVDASPLREFDSAALAVLLECRRLAQAWGKRFAVHGAPLKLSGLARLYGVEGLLGLDLATAASPA